jgi:hypothetical protein
LQKKITTKYSSENGFNNDIRYEIDNFNKFNICIDVFIQKEKIAG